MKTEVKITYPDYKEIRENSDGANCVLSEADFDTGKPNPYRVSKTASEINEYLKHRRKFI